MSHTVTLPCKIGDTAFAIRKYKGYTKVIPGVIDQMFFNKDMQLVISVKRIAYGLWGERIFPTEEQAKAAIEKRENAKI